MTKATERRLARLRGLWEKLGVNPRDHSSSSGEDAGALEEDVTKNGLELKRYLSVTAGQVQDGAIAYAHKHFDTIDEAQKHGLLNIDDDIYPEYPVRIYDLDNRRSWYPDWSSLKWARQHKSDED